jgi:plastocyanin
MKNSLLIISIFISSFLFAQNKVTVTVANFSFTANSVTIDVGDTVEFVNVSGTHWVDGRQAIFASNPVSFDNQAQSGSGWTYLQVFNTAGAYDYRCGIHTSSMTGTITVQLPTGIVEDVTKSTVDFYPNPASKLLNFSEYELVQSVTIYSITGKEVMFSKLTNNKLDVSTLKVGTYFVKIKSDNDETTKKLVIQ